MTTPAFDTARWKPAALLPREDARDGALTFVVAVLCFIACLAGMTALSADRAAQGWRAQLTGSATVCPTRPSEAAVITTPSAAKRNMVSGRPKICPRIWSF